MAEVEMERGTGSTRRIAVITPYHRESIATIRRAHDSVLRQSTACTHILVADGFPQPEVDGWDGQHIKLPSEHKDGGSFARGMGGLHAISVGFDYVAFLDADCWFDEDHIESLVLLAEESGCPVVTSRRKLMRLDGSLLCPDDDHSDGSKFADTSTMLIHRKAADLLALSAQLPPELGPICDLTIWIIAGLRKHRSMNTGRPTLNFQTRYKVHYVQRSEVPPPGTISSDQAILAQLSWNKLSDEHIHSIIRGSPKV